MESVTLARCIHDRKKHFAVKFVGANGFMRWLHQQGGHISWLIFFLVLQKELLLFFRTSHLIWIPTVVRIVALFVQVYKFHCLI